MDLKIFVFMTFLITLMVTYSSADRYQNSSLTFTKRRHSRLAKLNHKGHKTHKNHRKRGHGKKIKLRENYESERLRIRNEPVRQADSYDATTPYFEETEKIRHVAKKPYTRSILKSRLLNDYAETTVFDSYVTEASNSVEEPSHKQSHKRIRKPKRKIKMKITKYYKPDLKYLRMKHKLSRHGLNRDTDTPDNADGLMTETQETFSYTEPPTTTTTTTTTEITETTKKRMKGKKHSNNMHENNGKVHKKAAEAHKTYGKKKIGKNKNYKKSNFNNRKSTNQMQTTNGNSAEIIYITPRLRGHKKYNPEFQFLRIDYETINTDRPLKNITQPKQSNENDQDTDEIDSEQKETTYLVKSREDSDDRSPVDNDSEADTGDSNDNEDSSQDTEESGQQNDNLKKRRTAEEKWDDFEDEPFNYRNGRLRKSHRKQMIRNNQVKQSRIFRHKLNQKKKTTLNVENGEVPLSEYYAYREVTKMMKAKNQLKKLQERLAPILDYSTNYRFRNGSQDKTTRVTKPNKNINQIYFDEDVTRKYDPASKYREHYKHMRDMIFGHHYTKRSTKGVVTESTPDGGMRETYINRNKMQHGNNYNNFFHHKRMAETAATNKTTLEEAISTPRISDKNLNRYDPVINYNPKQNFVDVTINETDTQAITAKGFLEHYLPFYENTTTRRSTPSEKYVKRSTFEDAPPVERIKINRKHKKQKPRKFRLKPVVTTLEPEETFATSAEDEYGETTSEVPKTTEVKVTAKPRPTQQNIANIIKVPVTRHIPDTIFPDYVIAAGKNIVGSRMKHKLGKYNPHPTFSDIDHTEHPIVNIVEGMKNYFTVIGKGLYNSVKDIFKEETTQAILF